MSYDMTHIQKIDPQQDDQMMCIHLSWHHSFCNMSFQRMEGTYSFHRPRGEHCFQPNSPDCPSLTGKGKRHFNSVEHKSPARIAEQQGAGFKGVVRCIPTVLRESSQQTPMPMTSLLTCKPRLAEPLCKFFCTNPVQSRSCCRAGRSLGDVRQSTRKVNSNQTPKELGEVTCAGPEKLDVCRADLESQLLYLWLQLSKSHMRICA